MSDIFISYARPTADQAQTAAEAPHGLGCGVWRDDELPAHRSYDDVSEVGRQAAETVAAIDGLGPKAANWK